MITSFISYLIPGCLIVTGAVQPEEADELPEDHTADAKIKLLVDDEVDNGFSYRESRSDILSEPSQSIQGETLNKLSCIP